MSFKVLAQVYRSTLLSAALLLTCAQVGNAAVPRSKLVTASEVADTTVDIVIKKVARTQVISCLKTIPGSVTRKRGKLWFSSHSDQLAFYKKELKKAKSSKAKKKVNDKIALAKALRSAGIAACNEPASGSMRAYNGAFGEKQAARLIEVFALGGNPGLADRYVSIGMDAAVRELTTFKSDPFVDNFRAKLTCGPNPYNTTNPDTCFENENINDFYMDGYVSGLNWRSINSVNPAFMALFEWTMDQRAPGNPRVLRECGKWMFPRYVEMVDQFVRDGDYKGYAAKWVQDSFIHGKWLSGTSNRAGLIKVGNEDFAREFMELFTTGRDYPDGTPVYNDFDVFQASLAMSGLSETPVRDQSNQEICVIGQFADLHRPGEKVLFDGTPRRMVVDTADDMARKIFVSQRDQIAFELARRLWSRFISSKGTTIAYQRLAKEIIANDFKLWPVLTKMMKSQAFYAPEAAESILKNPHTLFVTFARMSGIPAGDYGQLSRALDAVGMQLGKPPTVFGFSYQNKLLASDVYQLERFNAFAGHALYQSLEQLKTRYNWTPYIGLVAGVPRTAVDNATDLINSVLKRLNMTDSTTQGQKDALVQFLNYSLDDCYSNTDEECFVLDGRRKKLNRSIPDPGNVNGDFYRLRMAYAMIANMPAFGTM